jgi:DNA-directed RNA polymerase sigma subunit (sigma70/sigma32)
MDDEKANWIEMIRKEVQSLLGVLTPREAKALRARFGLDENNRVTGDEEGTLRALARELAMLKRKKM